MMPLMPGSCSSAQNLHRRVATGCAHDSAAGMRADPALEEAGKRRAVLSPRRHRPKEEHLLERKLALEDVAFGKADDALDVGGRNHLPVQDPRLQGWRVLRARLD